jgi:hypothetical protein
MISWVVSGQVKRDDGVASLLLCEQQQHFLVDAVVD